MTDYKEAASLLGRWDHILILTHKRPDGDTVGCAVGLCALLRQLGKEAYVLENADATANFIPYLAPCAPPAGFVPDKVVAVDIAGVGLFPENAKQYLGKVDLAIDHHPSHEDFATYNCVEADKAACGEVLFKIVEELGGLTVDIATALYLAVSTDTGCFVYANVTPNTHYVAARLMELPIPFKAINKRHFRTKTMKRLQLENVLMENMEVLEEGKIVVSGIPLSAMKALNATEEDAEDIAAFLGQIDGALASATVRELKDGECKISLRTFSEYLNASETCALLGGGGHAAAAGCSVYSSYPEAVEAIKQAIGQVLHGA